MDYQNYHFNKRSHSMEVASLVLGIIAIAACSCIYISIVCGALSVLFAILSKGGSTSMSSLAVAGFCTGLIAIILTSIVYVVSFMVVLNEYGSIDAILKAYTDMTGLDYNELIEQMNTIH